MRWYLLVTILQHEAIYIWYYFSIQFYQILPYWVSGIVLGSIVSVFIKEKVHSFIYALDRKKMGILGVIFASLLGIASPLCMYGTIPLAAAFSQKGVKEDWIAAFMMSSILLNPQLIIYSTALGTTVLVIRIISCFVCGVSAGIFVHYFYKKGNFFNFSGFHESQNKDTDSNIFLRLFKNIGRNIKATGFWFLFGIILSALFQRYIPSEWICKIFGEDEGFGVLMAATVGVPLYACGGGTIPLLQQWLWSGMSLGSASAFMITGPATKITNLSALKIVLGLKKFLVYWGFIIVFSLAVGMFINFYMY